jgi:hypothetical protein
MENFLPERPLWAEPVFAFFAVLYYTINHPPDATGIFEKTRSIFGEGGDVFVR